MTPLKHHLLVAFVSFGLVNASQAQIKVQTGEKGAFLGDSITAGCTPRFTGE